MSPWLSWRLDSTSLYPLQFTCLQYSRYHDIVVALACAQSLQLCPALCNHMDCSPPGSSVHRILLARIVEWVAMPSSRGYSQPTDWIQVFCIFLIAGEFFTTEPLGKPNDFSFRSVQVSRSIMSDSLWSHGLQHAMLPCPSPTPRACSNSCPLSQWCHPTISSSVVPFSSCLQSFPASGSFPMSQLFTWGGQSIGVSASASVLPMNVQDWSPLGWTGWISLLSKGLSRVFSNTTVQKHQFFSAQLSLWSNYHIHTWLLEKP